jgi:outer membrane receptor protein involved in Fe transport
MSLLRAAGLVVSLLALMPSAGIAQPAQVGTLSGVVSDSTGGVLPGVTVTITSQERGFNRTTVTDSEGRYLFPATPIGNYTVVAQLAGFDAAGKSDNLVETEKTTSVGLTMSLGTLTEAVKVTGETPIVDMTNVSGNTRIRSDAFEKLPVGRSYQALIGSVPGVVGTGNVNALGALTSNNLFLMDSVDTTDPTTGTFGANLNFEAIQEVSVYTSGASAEYGRAQGAIVNVVTKSGTNTFEGSFKYIFQNDDWDAQNTTKSETTGASLERVKFDQVNPNYAFTGGGPLWRDRAWFFTTYERQENTTPQRQTVGQIPEDFQQSTKSDFFNIRGTVQLTGSHNVWVKYFRSPTNGFITDYWGAAGERSALTLQNQGAENWAGQWSGVLRNNLTMEAAAATYSSRIDVTTFEQGRLFNGAPIQAIADGKFYNGATFDGYVERPRQQFNVASTLFLTRGQQTHSIKAGFDFQNVESGSLFQYPTSVYYVAESFNQAAGTLVPQSRRDYQTGDSTSEGKNYALYIRDKFQVTPRFFLEAGLRYEKQGGTSDVGVDTVDASSLSPRFSSSYDIAGDGKSLIQGSYGRYYAGIIQSFSDAFANVPQQANYDNYTWNGSTYVFSNTVVVGASSFAPPADLKPYFMDEFTIGYQQQFGRALGAGVRVISRTWGDLIDDVRRFNPDGTIAREVVNYDGAERTYRGLQFTFDRRFAGSWSAGASYTYSRTEGNHFDSTFSTLGDYIDADCRTTVDLTIGNNGVLPCSEVQDGANKYGTPIYDRPHNFKLQGSYVKPIGPTSLVLGGVADAVSKRRYDRTRTMNVLRPGTLTNAGPTATYFYEERGSFALDGMEWLTDLSAELTWRVGGNYQAGFKTEIFNLTNREEKIISNNTVWCGSDAGAGCATARPLLGDLPLLAPVTCA